MADQSQDSLLREIDEEIRQERYAALWKRYGNLVIAAGIALILAVAGYQIWRTWDLEAREAAGQRFYEASQLAQGGDAQAALEAFAGQAVEAGGGYGLLARFREAGLAAQAGDHDRAAAVYREIAADGSVGKLYQDLAVLLGVIQDLNRGRGETAADRLAPLLVDANPWRFTAQEVTAVAALQAGDLDRARDLFAGLAADADAPQGTRTRAEEMLRAIGP